LFGVLNCSKAVLETMLKQKSGNIINISSAAARGPQTVGITIYGAGKGGIEAFTRNLAYELGPSGIRVNCIAPMAIKTRDFEAVEAGPETRTEVLKFWEERTPLSIVPARPVPSEAPLGRMGVPQDVASLVAFLASDVSSYITGQTISVNGGRFMV
jgi:NAD(P)-dependent dehydrogenase (short-subunit alcohol dehydrogenase family)